MDNTCIKCEKQFNRLEKEESMPKYKYEISYVGKVFVEAETEEEAIRKAVFGKVILEGKNQYEVESAELIR